MPSRTFISKASGFKVVMQDGNVCLYKLRFSEANIFSFDIAFVSALFLLMYQLQSCLGFEWSAPIAFFPQQPTHFQWAIL